MSTRHGAPATCSSCMLCPGVKLVTTGRGGRIRVWRCEGCLKRRTMSFLVASRLNARPKRSYGKGSR